MRVERRLRVNACPLACHHAKVVAPPSDKRFLVFVQLDLKTGHKVARAKIHLDISRAIGIDDVITRERAFEANAEITFALRKGALATLSSQMPVR